MCDRHEVGKIAKRLRVFCSRCGKQINRVYAYESCRTCTRPHSSDATLFGTTGTNDDLNSLL